MSIAIADESATLPIDWQQTDLYRFFARVFGPPTHECFQFMTGHLTPRALADLWKYLGGEGESPEFLWFATYDLYEAAYISLFDVGVPEPPVPLFESAHDKSHIHERASRRVRSNQRQRRAACRTSSPRTRS